MSRGIDISHWNTCTNYAAAKAAIDWIYIKVTEGAGTTDPSWVTHYNGFAGKSRGAYHFMRGSSATEVAHFVAVWRQRAWELPPMLDAEYPGVTGQAIKAFMNEFQRQTGRELTIIYAGKASLQGACNPALFITPRTIIWAARYFKNSADFSTLGWDHPQLGIYQYWNNGSVPGFTAGIDLDVARVSLDGTEDMAFTPEDFTSFFYNNPIQKFGNVSQLLADIVANVEGVPATVNAVKADVAAVKAAVAALQLSGVDLDALAAKVATLVPAFDYAALAKAVNDDNARRMAS